MRTAVLNELRAIVQEVAGWHMHRGKANAFAVAGDALGISTRRAQAYHWGEVRTVSAWEAEQMRARYQDLLAKRVEIVECDLAALRARLSRL